MKRSPMKRSSKRINPRSEKRINADLNKPAIREAVFLRDGHRCIMFGAGRCFGTPCTPHHLRKEGQGGKYVESNLVTLCSGHQTWVEDHPDSAHDLGLVVLNGETTEYAWTKLRAARLVP